MTEPLDFTLAELWWEQQIWVTVEVFKLHNNCRFAGVIVETLTGAITNRRNPHLQTN